MTTRNISDWLFFGLNSDLGMYAARTQHVKIKKFIMQAIKYSFKGAIKHIDFYRGMEFES